jgi:hypothetical protein
LVPTLELKKYYVFQGYLNIKNPKRFSIIEEKKFKKNENEFQIKKSHSSIATEMFIHKESH